MDLSAIVSRQVWPAIAVAVALNLVPVIGVLFWGWSVFALIFLYWIENVAIGVRTLASMLGAAVVQGGAQRWGVFFFAPFFTVHYGIFCAVHGAFVVVMFGGHLQKAGVAFESTAILRATMEDSPGFALGMLTIGLWQLFRLIQFLVGGEARSATLQGLMGAPYPRIVALHITILIGGGLVLVLGQPVIGILFLALFKLTFDLADLRPRDAAPPQ